MLVGKRETSYKVCLAVAQINNNALNARGHLFSSAWFVNYLVSMRAPFYHSTNFKHIFILVGVECGTQISDFTFMCVECEIHMSTNATNTHYKFTFSYNNNLCVDVVFFDFYFMRKHFPMKYDKHLHHVDMDISFQFVCVCGVLKSESCSEVGCILFLNFKHVCNLFLLYSERHRRVLSRQWYIVYVSVCV
jgi:hypothetical protein